MPGEREVDKHFRKPVDFNDDEPVSIQCSNCGCGYVVGLDPDAKRFAREVIGAGYGLRLVPDCPGCACHTGIAPLPFLRVKYAAYER
jgi:hypothetical protein